MTRKIPEDPKLIRTTTVRKNGRRRVSDSTGTESRVEPQHANETNINTIMRKMHAQGVLPHFKTGGNFGNFELAEDFHTAQNRIIAAQDDFMRLPSELRSKFDNDPGKLIDFLSNCENRAEAVDMGLIAPDGYVVEPNQKTPEPPAQEPVGDKKPDGASV